MYFSALNNFQYSFDWNPVFLELIWFVIIKISGNLGLFYLFFSITTLLSLIFIFDNVCKKHWYKNFLAFVIFCLSPLYLLYSPHLYKDIPFSAMIVAAIAIIKFQKNKISYYSWIPLILSGLIRHNGLLLAAFIVFYQSWLVKKKFVSSLAYSLLFIFLFFSAKVILLKSTIKEPGVSGTAHLLPMFDVSGIIALRDQPLPNNHFLNSKTEKPLEHSIYKKIYRFDDVEPFLYDTSNIVLIHTETEKSNFFSFWLKTILTNPKEYILHRLKFFMSFITVKEDNGRSTSNGTLQELHNKKSLLHTTLISPITNAYVNSNFIFYNIEYILFYIIASLASIFLLYLKKDDVPHYISILNISGLFYTMTYLFIGSSPAFKYVLFHPWSVLIVYLYIIFSYRLNIREKVNQLMRSKAIFLSIFFILGCTKNYSSTFDEYLFCINPETPSEHYVGEPYIHSCLTLLQFIPDHPQYLNQLKILCVAHNLTKACKLSKNSFSIQRYLEEVVKKNCFTKMKFNLERCKNLDDQIRRNTELKNFQPLLNELINKGKTNYSDFNELTCKYFKELKQCST